MRATVTVFVLAIVGAQAGCEWYKNCGACVADSGCGWCSNDPAGVGSGSVQANDGTGKKVNNIRNSGAAGNLVSATDGQTSLQENWLVNVRGQYEKVTGFTGDEAELENELDFEGTGYVASPYFGQTWGGANRDHGLIGLHKTKFTSELKASHTITPYTMGTYTISSVQTDTQATLTSAWTDTFNNLEFQIGNYEISGTASYPDTSKQDLYGSWPPNPTKFTTELKDGYTIGCSTEACGPDNVRVARIYNDQHLYVDPRFTTSFTEKTLKVNVGPRGTGLVSGTSGSTRVEGSDPCRTSNNEPCRENTRFLSELRRHDLLAINQNGTGVESMKTVDEIYDDAHLALTAELSEMLSTKSTFRIKSFHSSPFTFARKANGGLSHNPTANGNQLKVTGYNTSAFTKNLMEGYAIIVKMPVSGVYEKRTVTGISAAGSLTVDAPFSEAFGWYEDASAADTEYNYESCPSLTYENFDLRTENGPGVISTDGRNWVYDNVQYSKVTTYPPCWDHDATPPAAASPCNHNNIASAYDAQFVRHLRVGYTITMGGITRTVTKIVDNTLLHVDRAFAEDVSFTDFSYRYSVRKTGDFLFHWKPDTTRGDHHIYEPAVAAQIYTRNMDADFAESVAGSAVSIAKQDHYLQYPPVCYNTGRCVPKTSHSLVGVEKYNDQGVGVHSSALPHETAVLTYVQVNAQAGSWMGSDEYFSNCKPICTITVTTKAADTNTPGGTYGMAATRRLRPRDASPRPGWVNGSFVEVESAFPAWAEGVSAHGRVRYVTGTGTVKVTSSADLTTTAPYTVTGASKETKTKFNSEFASGWTITIGCGGSTCTGNRACTSDSDCVITTNGVTRDMGGKCLASTDTYFDDAAITDCSGSNCCGAETVNISSVTSDTQLTTTGAFANSYTKVDYTIGMIPGLGMITNSENSMIIDGNANTRFMEQLRVGYTITANTETRTIKSIQSNMLMTVSSGWPAPGITSPISYKFSGKKGTGEVSVLGNDQASGIAAPMVVTGTSDVTQTQFLNELAPGYLFMVGNDYKVVTSIESNTKLTVDTPFHAETSYTGDDYNYESCWLSMGAEAGITENDVAQDASWTSETKVSRNADYTNKKVYIEDACEIKPGCCGFKVSSVVYPDRFAYYKIRPAHTNMNIRVVVKTTEDNVDLVVKRAALPTTSSYDYKSVRESNPWALTVPQDKITCPTYLGPDPAPGASAGITAVEASESSPTINRVPPRNCDYWYIGVRGDNRYPQKTGASEYDLYVYTEFDWPNFLCDAASVTSHSADDQCKWLGISKNEDANMVNNDDDQAVMRLTPSQPQTKGSMYYSTKVHLYNGFETTFQFRMTGFSVGCNSVLYPSGFCGGGDGFAFVIQKTSDTEIGCTGSGLGYAKVDSSKQENDWARHRCTSVSSGTSNLCDTDDDGVFDQNCEVGTLCQVSNSGCGTSGVCGFQSCNQAPNMVLAVEFDTWNNLKLHDPKQGVSRWWINATEFVGYNDNHVAIFASNSMMESDHAKNEHFAATPSIPNLADGKNHTVKIKYFPHLNDPGKESDGTYNRTNHKLRGALHNANLPACGDCEDTRTTGSKLPAPDNCWRCKLTNTHPGNFAIFIDDMKRPVLQTQISLRKSSMTAFDTCYDEDRDRCVLDEIGNAYIGFTASTGGERAGGRTSRPSTSSSPYTTSPGEWDHTAYDASVSQAARAAETAGQMLGAAQNHEILNWKFCNQIGCVPI